MKIGAQIKRIRTQRGISQLDLALAIGYNGQGNVSRIEKDEQWPDGERLDAIADALGCNVSDFFVYAECENEAEINTGHHSCAERIVSYMAGEKEPSLDEALRAVEFELPAIDSRTQAVLTVEVFKAVVSKQNTDRVVGALNSLVIAVEQMGERGGYPST